MKKSLIIFSILVTVVITLLLSSCKDKIEELIVPSIAVAQPDINVGFAAGETKVDFTSNVIFYAKVEDAAKKWLQYKFRDSCKTLSVVYFANDTTIQRVGHITISKSGVEQVLTVTQAGNPDANNGKFQKIQLVFSVNNAGGYTILSAAAGESAKIPLGATVVLKCPGDVGTISFLNPATYAEYAGGAPVQKEFKFVWTQQMANITATSGIMAILRGGFTLTDMSCIFTKSNVVFTTDNSSGYNILSVSAAVTAKIPVGATIVLECPSDAGTVSFINSTTYAEYAGGSSVNGKFAFSWTQKMADATSSSGIMAILRGGFQVNSLYFVYVKTDLVFSVNTAGGYTILNAAATESAKIPIGATVVLKCPADVGTISFINPTTYAEYAGGAPVNGVFSFVWTKEISVTTATAGMMAILRGGFTTTAMSCHN